MPKRDLIYQGKILSLLVLDDRWEVVEHADAVAILALRGREVLGVLQHRPAIGAESWEIPAGLIEAGERPIEAAQRELAEEAQLSGRLELISQFYASPGFSDEKIYLYLAADLAPCLGAPDPDEELRVVWRDLDELWNAVAEGRLESSAPSVLALSVAKALLR